MLVSRTRRRTMPQDPGFVTPAAMEEKGGYNRSSQVQAAGLSPAVPMLEHAARTAALPAGSQPIVIADYGSSEGHNSLLPLGAAIAILRERIGPRPRNLCRSHRLARERFLSTIRTIEHRPEQLLAQGSCG